MAPPVFVFNPQAAQSMLHEIMERSGQNLTACYQCRRCAAGCPVGQENDHATPDRLIRAIVVGDREQALNHELVWKCVSCYTCGTRCPNNIHTVKITETLKQMAKEAGVSPSAPKVAAFHEAFVASGLAWGRVNEAHLMGIYVRKSVFKDLAALNFSATYQELRGLTDLAVAMLKHKRMHFGWQSAKGRSEINRLNPAVRAHQGDGS